MFYFLLFWIVFFSNGDTYTIINKNCLFNKNGVSVVCIRFGPHSMILIYHTKKIRKKKTFMSNPNRTEYYVSPLKHIKFDFFINLTELTNSDSDLRAPSK